MEAVELAAQAGLHLDPWQQLVLVDALGERADGKWAAFEVAMIVARQNGKSAVFEARALAGLFLLGEQLILYSAHEFKTASEMFRRILSLIEGNAAFRKRVKAVARSKGEEGVELVTGQRLRFVARSTGSARGFSADCVMWDECQNLPDAAVDAMVPTMNARPNPQLWYGGSAPDKNLAPCEQITRVRNRALSEAPGGLAYFEWSAQLCTDLCATSCSDHDSPSDPATWAKTNPGLGVRIDLERIEVMHATMSRAGFAREVLSVGNYPSEAGGWEVISEAAWRQIEDAESRPGDPVVFAIDVTPEQSHAAIAVAGRRPDGLIHVEVIDHRPGTAWVIDRVRDLKERWSPAAIVMDAGGPAGSLAAEFAMAEIELAMPTYREVGQAYGSFYSSVVRPIEADESWCPTLRARPHPALSSALAGATRRPIGDAFAWNRRGVSVDISPLVAVTLARWGLEARPPEPPPPPPATARSAPDRTSDFFRPRERLSL